MIFINYISNFIILKLVSQELIFHLSFAGDDAGEDDSATD